MMAIVIVQDNTPVVSHRVIAENTGNQAKHLFELISKHKSDFEQFGHLPFETETVTNSAKAINKSKTYYLNEQQSTLLMTYLRNSEIVRKFKIALVKEFYELREKNSIPYSLLYSKELECIELKREVNQMKKSEKLIFNDPQTHNEVLDLIGYASRATKTIKHLGQDLLEYGKNMEAKLASIQKKHGHKNGVITQCKRLPRHQERRD